MFQESDVASVEQHSGSELHRLQLKKLVTWFSILMPENTLKHSRLFKNLLSFLSRQSLIPLK